MGDALVKGLTRQRDTFGMTGRQAAIYEAQQEGVSDAQLDSAKALDQQLTAMERQKTLMGQLKGLGGGAIAAAGQVAAGAMRGQVGTSGIVGAVGGVAAQAAGMIPGVGAVAAPLVSAGT